MEKFVIDPKIGLTIFNNVLSDSDIEQVLALASPNMLPGTVVSLTDKSRHLDPSRTCMIEHLNSSEEIVYKLKRLSAEISNMPLENQERLQLIHYAVGGNYKPHFDAFNPGNKHIDHSGNRKATVIFYLNNVEKGGATGFPNLNKMVFPKKGSAVLFYNTDDSGDILEDSLHSGEPIIDGEKWIVTSWIREHRT